jgi:hypothetical protein
MTPSPDVIRSYQGSQGQGPINVNIQLQRSRAMRIEQDGLQAALRFWPPKSVHLNPQFGADIRSIPLIIAKSMEGSSDEPRMVHHVPRGVPGSDLGQHLQLRLRDGEIQTTSGSYVANGPTSRSAMPTLSNEPSELDALLGIDRAIGPSTSSGPSSDRPNDDIGIDGTFHIPTSDHLTRGQYDTGTATSANQGDATPEIDREQTLWDLINGEGVGSDQEDLDFSAFLQNFNDNGSAN